MLKNIIAIIFIYLYSHCASAEIYKWVDEQGNIHYGDKPNANSTEMEITVSKKSNVKISQSREVSRKKLLNAYDVDNKRKAEEKEKLKKKKKKQKQNCINAKDTLRTYARARFLYDLDKDGNRVTMSNEEREKTTSDLKKSIKKYCK